MKVFNETFQNTALPLKGGVNRGKRFTWVIFENTFVTPMKKTK